MPRSGFQAVSRRIHAEKALKHIGTAEVKLHVLDFSTSNRSNAKNVERLARLFNGQRGYSPGEPQNRIPAVIDEADLHAALTVSGLSRESLLTCGSKHARLDFPQGFRLACLRGRDRVQAFEEVSCSPDPHWVVDLFIADISDEAKRDLAEGYSSEQPPGDGVFFYKIRKYQGIFGEQDEYLENKWWARLGAVTDSEHRKRELNQLFGHQKFAPAFDAFRHLPALYGGLRLTVINRMISMRCHEELLEFLRHTKDFWYHVFDGDVNAMEKLDEATVDAMQLTAPGACERQARELYFKVSSGEIFSTFSETERNRMWLRICSATVDCLVPSLFAFFENLKYLQAAADCLRRLVNSKTRQSLRCAFEKAFSPGDADQCLIQTSWASFKTTPTSAADSFDIAYRQLWLYALREQRNMPIARKQKLAIAGTVHADEVVISRFARLAQKLGFKTDVIKALALMDPDREIARRLLITAKKPEEFEYYDMASSINKITDILGTARPISAQSLTDEDGVEGAAKPPLLCGTPRAADHARDKPYMFLDKLHGPIERHHSRLTSFFVQRSIYFAFFGKDVGIPMADLVPAEDVHMLDHDSTRAQRLPMVSRAPTLQRPLEDDERQTNLRRRLEEQESRLQRLATTEQQLSANIEQLRNNTALEERRVLALNGEEQAALQRLNSLEQTEAEQVLRLETLKTDEQTRRSQIVELERRRTVLGDQIRLDLLAASEEERPGTAGQEGNSPNGDAVLQLELATSVKGLRAEGERLRLVVEKLTLQIGELDDDTTSKVASMASLEVQHRSVVDKLVAEERALQDKIGQLEACLQQLQTRLYGRGGEEPGEEQPAPVDTGGAKPPTPLERSSELPGTATEDNTATTGSRANIDAQKTNRLGLDKIIREALSADDGSSERVGGELEQATPSRSASRPNSTALREDLHEMTSQVRNAYPTQPEHAFNMPRFLHQEQKQCV
ncbi:hypothetical protein K4F52_009413 [Lecanicillium sp. MT-2017a]|nr:hypothetical protein K4F52_009413 [Lecanicillium sp. MT-2017a]